MRPADQKTRLRGERALDLAQELRDQRVIVAEHRRVLAPRVTEGELPAVRHRQDAIGPDRPHAIIGELAHDARGVVVGGVVAHHDLEVVVTLLERALQGLPEQMRAVPRGHHDREARCRLTHYASPMRRRNPPGQYVTRSRL